MTPSFRRPSRSVTEQRASSHSVPLASEWTSVEEATEALRQARLEHRPQSEVRAHCQGVVKAYDHAIAAAEADLRSVLGPLEGMPRTRVIAARHRSAAQASERVLERLRLERQRHLLMATPACGPSYAGPAEAAARGPLGPHWPETDYLPEKDVYGTRRILSPQQL
jgi:hypothetical protein